MISVRQPPLTRYGIYYQRQAAPTHKVADLLSASGSPHSQGDGSIISVRQPLLIRWRIYDQRQAAPTNKVADL